MSDQHGRAFNEWLRVQLKVRRMSVRHLAEQSGVDHSTIYRLIHGDRMPSLGTATKLARGLREVRDEVDAPEYLGAATPTAHDPVARVEYALRADESLSEAQVRRVMVHYLAVRAENPPDRGHRASPDREGAGERYLRAARRRGCLGSGPGSRKSGS